MDTDFRPSSYSAPVEDLCKEYEAWDAEKSRDKGPTQEESYRFNSDLINKGRLDRGTGLEIPVSSKARKVSSWVPTRAYKQNFDACFGS